MRVIRAHPTQRAGRTQQARLVAAGGVIAVEPIRHSYLRQAAQAQLPFIQNERAIHRCGRLLGPFNHAKPTGVTLYASTSLMKRSIRHRAPCAVTPVILKLPAYRAARHPRTLVIIPASLLALSPLARWA